MLKSRQTKLFALLVGIAAVLLLSPYLIAIILLSRVPPLAPVDERAIQSAHEVLSAIEAVPPDGVIATFRADCYAFVLEHLEASQNPYTLKLTAAFDPDDARFLPAANYVNGSWDATVEVRFADEREVELYFYNGTWEGCYNLPKSVGEA
jgi:hypothetical protein